MRSRSFYLYVFLCLVCACGMTDDGQRLSSEADQIVERMTETGTLMAVRYTNIIVPWASWDYGRQQIAYLEKEGTQVRKGDVVARIETSGVLKVLDSKKPELAIAQAELNELMVNHSAALKKLNSDLQSNKAALQLAIIDTQRVAYESDAKKEITRLKLLQARISLRKIEEKIKSTREVQKEELKIQHAKIAQILSDIETAERTIERFTIRAPADGLVEYQRNRRTREKVSVGDQVYFGLALVGLPDLSKMKVLTSVNETDIQKVYTGQKSTVRLDAYPDFSFDGVVTSVARTCHRKDNNDKVKVFDVEILLDETHRILKPGMTVSCDLFIPAQVGALVRN